MHQYFPGPKSTRAKKGSMKIVTRKAKTEAKIPLKSWMWEIMEVGGKLLPLIRYVIMHPHYPEMHTYCYWQLTPNFELWVEIFHVLKMTCFHIRIPKFFLSICLYPEKRNHVSLVNISWTVGSKLCINGKFFTSTSYSMETQKFSFLFKKRSKLNFDLCWSAYDFSNIARSYRSK